MRHYDDDDDEKKAYRPPARKKIDPDEGAHPFEEASAAPAPKVHTAQMAKADPPRKVYRASSAASLKKKAAEGGKPQAFSAEEQSVTPGPSVRTNTASQIPEKKRITPPSGGRQQLPGAVHVSGRTNASGNDGQNTILFEPEETRAEGIPAASHQPPPPSETIPFQYAQAEVVKQPIAVAAVIDQPEKTDHVEKTTPVVPETLQETVGHDENDKGTSNNKKNLWIGIIVLLVVVVVVVIVVVVIVTGGGGDGPLSEEEIINLVQSRSPSTTFDNPSSPQRLTLDWMTQDKNTQEITDKDRILQRFAIGTLYYATGYSLFAEAEPNECNWYGVGCRQSDVVVDWISLHNTNLDGSLPREIGLLTGLTWLDLSNNFALEGWIPSEISKLNNLNELYLSDTELTGSIPSNLCNGLQQALIDCDEVVCNCCQCN